MTKITHFIKQNTVFCIAALAAIVTCFIIKPDNKYLTYPDYKTLSCLFLTLAVICALKDINFFSIIANKIVLMTGNLRVLALALVYITFIGSMLIANDMALITFLPLGYYALSSTNNKKHMAYVFILQNISANLGGMLTPFGNPQNLYIYSAFNIPTAEFTSIMFKPFLLAITMLTICCLFLKPTPLTISENEVQHLDMKKSIIYSIAFLFSLLIVFRVIPYYIGLAIIPIIIFIFDKKAFVEIDYALLGTFFFFFIFSGNMSRIPAVNNLLSSLLQKDTLLVSELSCQFISNVPSAILLSRFTSNYKELLLGVNIGGTGTIISSLASLITFSHFKKLNPGHTKQYLILFTLLNFIFLITMTIVTKLLFI